MKRYWIIALVFLASGCHHAAQQQAATARLQPYDMPTAYSQYITRYNSFTKRYVSPSGTGTTCSQASPCSMAQGVGQGGPNIAVMFNDGTYPLSSNFSSSGVTGTSAQHAAFVGVTYGGAHIVHSGGAADGDPIWRTAGGSYLDFVGLDWTGPNKCWTTYNYPTSNNTGGYLFAFNKIHDIGTDPSTNTTCGNGRGGGGIGASAISNASTAGAFTVLNNIIWNMGNATNGHWVHGVYVSNQGSVMINNVIYNIRGAGISTWNAGRNITMVNNTIYNADQGGGNGSIQLAADACVAGGLGSGFTVVNNIVANSPGRGLQTYCGSGQITNATITNTLNNGNATPTSWNSGTPTYTNTQTGSPNFVNAAGGNFHVNPGSPALGNGTPNNAPANDIEGTVRPNPPSIGAYDSGAAPPPPPPPASGTPWVTFFSTPTTGSENAYVGDDITVGSQNVPVLGVCRWIVSGNTQAHTVGFYDPAPPHNVIAGSSTSVPSAGIAGGQMHCVDLPAQYMLQANTRYFLMSQEVSADTRATCAQSMKSVTNVASINGYVYSPSSWSTASGFCGVGFTYGTPVAPPGVVAISISPTWLDMAANTTAQFTGTVTGNSNTNVNYSASQGNISSSGLFTAPNVATTATITAQAQADPTKEATATVTVSLPPPPPGHTCEQRFRIVSATWSGGTTTVRVNNTLPLGATVTMSQASPTAFNGMWNLATANPTQVTYSEATNPGGTATSGVLSYDPPGCVSRSFPQ